MTTYTSVFGNETVPPSENAYATFTISANTTFYWPENAVGSNVLADITEINASVGSLAITLPDATLVSVGRAITLSNSGSNTFTYKDAAGNVLGTLASGISKCVYLTGNSTAAGTWHEFSFGAVASTVNPASLDGYGLTVTSTTLSQEYPTNTTAASNNIVAADRAKTFIYTSTGAVTCNLLAASAAGDGFFINVTNQGTGALTIDPSTTEMVDGASTKDLAPGESATLVCDGYNWYSVGYGRSTQYQFTKLVLDISAGGTFTLTSAQAQNKLIQFIGIAPGNFTVIVPTVVAVYYLQSSYTGAYTATIKTAAGLSVVMGNTDRSIVYCDGTDVVLAQTSAVPAVALAGGVAGSIVYQSNVSTTGFSAAGTTNQVLISGGTGSPTWSNNSILTNTYTSKATPVDADSVTLYDSAATTTATKVTWANIKATLKTYFDTLYTVVAGNNVWTGTQTFRDNKFEITDDGDTTKKFVFQASSITTATTRTITIPDADITLVNLAGNNTWTGTQTFRDNKFEVTDDADTTKKLVLQLSGITTATTRTLTVPDASTTIAGLSVKQTFTAQQTPMNGTLTDGANIDWNGDSNGQVVSVTLAGNRTMNAPTNIQQNALYLMRVTQDGTGSRTLSWNTAYKFGGTGAPTLTTTASKVDWLWFVGGSGNTLEHLGSRLNAV